MVKKTIEELRGMTNEDLSCNILELQEEVEFLMKERDKYKNWWHTNSDLVLDLKKACHSLTAIMIKNA